MDNEFESLIDIVLARGIKHSELISIIQETILKEYSERYSKETKDVEIVINEKTGNVRFFLNKTDVTPSDFILVAEKIARQVIIQKLKEIEDKKMQFSKTESSGGVSKWLIYYLFYVYNTIYFIFAFLQTINFILNGEFRADIIGKFEAMGLVKEIFMLMLFATPLISVVIAYKAKILRKYPQLARLVFSFEIPLIILFIIALFLKEAASIMWFLWLMAFFVVIDFSLEFIKPNTTSSRRLWLVMILRQSALMTATYLVLLYSFFLPVFFFGFLSYMDIDTIIVFIISIIGILYMAIYAMLLSYPFLILRFLFKRHLRLCKDLIAQAGKKRMITAHLVVVFVWIVSLCIISYQPNESLYLEKLKKLSAVQTFEEKEIIARELVPKEKIIKREIENISSARKRYIIAKDYSGLKESYKKTFGFSDEMAGFVQNVFTGLAYPFVYQGVFDDNYYNDEFSMAKSARASIIMSDDFRGRGFGRQSVLNKNYEYLFGHSLNDYNPSPINNVNLVSRMARATSDYQGLLATVSIEEEYMNATWGNQEVVYEFSLPANSAIIDLKLGPNLEFDGVVAPRGAASKVYQQELTRRRDPALLEQTGPRQYRLRVFPIPGKDDKTTLGGKNQKVKFSYVTELTSQGYPLPVYSKKQNVEIGTGTKVSYYLDNNRITSNVDSSFIKSASTQNISNNLCNLSSPISLKSQQNENISAQIIPYNAINETIDGYKCDKNSGVDLISSLKGSKFAILYDVSSDNKGNSFLDDFKKTLLSEKTLLEDNIIDLYLFNDLLSEKKKITLDWVNNSENIAYFGKGDWINAIKKIDAQYDFIIIIASNSDMPKEASNLDIKNTPPLYIIHKDNKVPAYPIKISNYLVQGGGDVVSSFKDALTQYTLSRQLRKREYADYVAFSPFWSIKVSDAIPQSFVDQLYIYNVNPRPTFDTKAFLIENAINNFHIKAQKDDPLSYLVSKAYLSRLLSFHQGDLENKTTLLDNFNSFAKNSHFVSPFSSLIALVNEQQQANLENASQEQDRYSYNVSSGVPSGGILRWGSAARPESVPTDIRSATLNLVNWILGFIALNLVAAIILGIVGSFTAKGNKDKLKDAKKVLFWGLVSVMIVMFIYAIINVVTPAPPL